VPLKTASECFSTYSTTSGSFNISDIKTDVSTPLDAQENISVPLEPQVDGSVPLEYKWIFHHIIQRTTNAVLRTKFFEAAMCFFIY
jgi:hypothetical protein